jgi:Spy/CpxP family protein refolding chaperone
MTRVRFPYVVLVLLVLAWQLPVVGSALGPKHTEEKGEQKASCAVAEHDEAKHAEKQCTKNPTGKEKYHSGDLDQHMAILKAKLQMVDEQVVQMKALLEAKKEGLKATMAELKAAAASQEELKKAIQEAKIEFEAKLAEILSSEQLGKYKELTRSYKEWKKERQTGETCKKKDPLAGLDLTDDQKAQFNEITGRYHEIQQELVKQMMSELKEVLTPEQLKQFEAMKEHHKMGKPEASESVE